MDPRTIMARIAAAATVADLDACFLATVDAECCGTDAAALAEAIADHPLFDTMVDWWTTADWIGDAARFAA